MALGYFFSSFSNFNHLITSIVFIRRVELVEPQSTAIARLTAFSVCAAVQMKCPQKKGEPAKTMDVEQVTTYHQFILISDHNLIFHLTLHYSQELEGSKIMRMNDLQSGNTRLVYESIGCGSSSQQQTISDGPLLKALTILFRAFDNIADRTGVVTSDTYFVFNVIREIVNCGKDTAKPILANLSSTLVRMDWYFR